MINVLKSASSAGKQLQQQQVRWMRYRKAPDIPRAKSKRFYVHVKKERDADEVALSKEIWSHYKANMRSVYQLFKAEYKFMGQESEKARQEKELIAKREASLLMENEKLNKAIFDKQMADLTIKLQKEAEAREHKLLTMKKRDELYKEAVERKVKDLEEKSKRFIDPNNLEYEIEKMLNERVDYNFCIDSNGMKYYDEAPRVVGSRRKNDRHLNA